MDLILPKTVQSPSHNGHVLLTGRRALAEIKADHYPQYSIDELCFTRDEAGTFCQMVRKRRGAPRLTRPFILRSLVGLRKNKPKAGAKRATVAQSADDPVPPLP